MKITRKPLEQSAGSLRRDAALFLLGGLIYPLVEIFWRGYTHWSMAPTGGLCLAILGRIARLPRGYSGRCLLAAAAITGIELACGWLVNKRLRWRVWDYSHRRWHWQGQICLSASLRWLALSAALLPLLRGRLRETKP